MWNLRGTFIGVLTLTFLLIAPSAAAAPITFNTALPVSEAEVIYRQQFIISRAADDTNGLSRDVTEIKGVSVLGYGVTPELAVFGVLPVIHREREIGPLKEDALGLGDAAFFARYQIFRRDAPGRTVRLAPFAGLNVPTGKRGRTGDGSVDAFGGLILTVATTDWVLDGQIRYAANTEAEDFERGDTLEFDASLQYRLLPRQLSVGAGGFLFAVIEANVTHRWKNRVFAREDPDSGGVLMILSPGVQFAAKRWIAEAALRLPVLKELNGIALEPDYSAIASLRVNF